ncbi:hypothetical protein QJS83_08470 [Bdellovibrio sp. 22V]|uniref:hypothetical protein n=1 Tax=Bdellovibrio TaxID=958 RepID=UPI002542A103|nr:hypothetical protein [Bdellovibrio sp. 22V]WII73908.1 hypothetical protein QJS83_08470 [Bdellovibrio sp. 22V]
MKRFNAGIFKPVQNSRGMLSAEFIFALVLSAGLCIVLFALNFTLSMAEVAQYIAFSTSRAHAAGHLDTDRQKQMGEDKFKALVNNAVLKPLFNNPDGGWFTLTDLDIRQGGLNGNTFENDYKVVADRVPQVGVRFNYNPKLLSVKIAFLGSTSDDPNGEGFTAKVTGLLIREPTFKECWDLQIKQRYSAILNLDPRYKVLGGSGANKYVPMEDNGC